MVCSKCGEQFRLHIEDWFVVLGWTMTAIIFGATLTVSGILPWTIMFDSNNNFEGRFQASVGNAMAVLLIGGLVFLVLGFYGISERERDIKSSLNKTNDAFDYLVCSSCGSQDVDIPFGKPAPYWAKCNSCGAILGTGYTIKPIDVEGKDKELGDFMRMVCSHCPSKPTREEIEAQLAKARNLA